MFFYVVTMTCVGLLLHKIHKEYNLYVSSEWRHKLLQLFFKEKLYYVDTLIIYFWYY